MGRFASSFGVRNGFVAESEQALPEGLENLRHFPRRRMTFEIQLDGQWRRVAGDVSGGGVLFLLPFRAHVEKLEVLVRTPDLEWQGAGRLLGTDQRGERFGHHVKFIDAAKAAQLAHALETPHGQS
jgi:hypothetical protein